MKNSFILMALAAAAVKAGFLRHMQQLNTSKTYNRAQRRAWSRGPVGPRWPAGSKMARKFPLNSVNDKETKAVINGGLSANDYADLMVAGRAQIAAETTARDGAERVRRINEAAVVALRRFNAAKAAPNAKGSVGTSAVQA